MMKMEIISRLYMFVRLEHSRKKCEEGVLTDEEFDELAKLVKK